MIEALTLNDEPCRFAAEAVSLKLKMIVNIAEGEIIRMQSHTVLES